MGSTPRSLKYQINRSGILTSLHQTHFNQMHIEIIEELLNKTMKKSMFDKSTYG
jgi:hypothetical protein